MDGRGLGFAFFGAQGHNKGHDRQAPSSGGHKIRLSKVPWLVGFWIPHPAPLKKDRHLNPLFLCLGDEI